MLWGKLSLLVLKGQNCKESLMKPLENGCGSAIRVHSAEILFGLKKRCDPLWFHPSLTHQVYTPFLCGSREETLAAVPELQASVELWLAALDRLESGQQALDSLHSMQAMLVDAASDPSHSLYSLSDR